MIVFSTLAGLFLAAAPAQAIERVDVAFDRLAAEQNEAAIREIEANRALAADDPARLINLGVAHARQGDADTARDLFRSAMFAPDRQLLETDTGEWVDSRVLARQALALLDSGELAETSRMASAR